MKIQKGRLELVAEPGQAYEWDGRTPLSDAATAAKWFAAYISQSPQEKMAAIYVDTRNRPLGWAILFTGGINRLSVEPRPVLQTALLLNAAGFFLAHNHPSGDPSPSAEDLSFTRRMANAGEVVGVRLIDHLIIGGEGRWTSLKDRGGW